MEKNHLITFPHYTAEEFARIVETAREVIGCSRLSDLTDRERTAVEAIVSLMDIDGEASERVYDAWDAVHIATAADNNALINCAEDAGYTLSIAAEG